MIEIRKYKKTDNCHTGEIDGYGYALIPGSKRGVVLLDIRTKLLLDDLSIFRAEKDLPRAKLLLENGLIQSIKSQLPKPCLEKNKIRGMSTWLHIANCCNLKCPYCYIANKGKGFMSFPIANLYLDKLEQTVNHHGLDLVTIRLAGGEPTLHKTLIRFLIEQTRKRFTEKGIRVKLILLTNGTLLDPDLVKMIRDNSVRVCMSLDGLGEWHNKTRFFSNGTGSFDGVVKNLNLCLENDVRPTILTTITDKNISGILMLSSFLIDANIPFRYGLYRDNIGGFKEYDGFIEKVSGALDSCYDYYAHAIRNHGATAAHQLCEIHLDRKPHLRGCNIGYSGVTVDHNGNVFVCQARMDKKPIGNLESKKTLLEIAWSQDTFPELRSKDVFDYKDCRGCQWSLVCGGGCPVINFGAHGLATTSSPYCKFFKSMIPRLIELKALQLIWGHVKTKEVI